jgi:hypothetical protein
MISNDLIQTTFTYFEKHYKESFVVKPSLPILYFGNLDLYKNSKLKIVTVGKNPSDNEFKIHKEDKFSFCRFPVWNPEINNLKETLNDYFERKPLFQWFSCFEPILNALNCSFFSDRNYENAALHTDICSPLATDPTWGKLTKGQQSILYPGGVNIWRQLINELQPDILLISVQRAIFSDIISSEGKILLTFNRKKDGELRKKEYKVFSHECISNLGKRMKVVYGRAANKPFDTISNEQKKQIGEALCPK